MKRNPPSKELYNIPWSTNEFNGMPYRILGRSGLRVSNVGLGTWKFGYPETGDGSRVSATTAFQIFDLAVDLGVTFWDTANRYNAASGNSERVIGDWLELNPGQRRNLVIATKLYGGMDGLTPNHSHLSRMNILDSVYASLDRLGITYIDLLYFHAYDLETPIEESLCAIDDLIHQDLVRYFAVSNFSVNQIQQYQELEKHISPRTRIVAVQNQFNILDKESPEIADVLNYCAAERISFVAYSPLGRGLLTTRYLDQQKIGKGDRLYDEKTLENDLTDSKTRIVKQLNEIAQRYGLELSQMVLAYMLTLPGMGPVIPASSTVEQLRSNAASGKISLSADLCAEIATVVTQIDQYAQ